MVVQTQKITMADKLRPRVGKGWYGVVTPGGWDWIIEKIDNNLSTLDSKYEIHQVKQKYGTLRFYYEPSENVSSEIREVMNSVVELGEILSAATCEECGNCSLYGTKDFKQDHSVKLRTERKYYWRTLCDSCNSSLRNLK